MEHKDTALKEKSEIAEKISRFYFRNRKALISVALIIFVVVIFLSVVWFNGRNQAKMAAQAEIAELKAELQKKNDEIEALHEAPIVVSRVNPQIVLDVINSNINNIGELSTVEYLFTDTEEFSDSRQIKNWNVPFTEKSFILKWSGVIKAGIELKDLKVDVDDSANKIILTIPTAKILSYEIDNDSVKVITEKNNIFNSISVNDKVKADAATENAMKTRAIENGLLEKAQKNAEDILSRVVKSIAAVDDNYTIEFTVAK